MLKKKTSTKWLKLISHASAWLLLITVVVLIVSGWGITQTGIIYKITFGLIDRRTADAIHRATNVPLAVFFLSHILANIRLIISTKRPVLIWLTNILLIVAGLGILAIFIIMEIRI
jgi:cytochrome b subunit of formate dehydrogenase